MDTRYDVTEVQRAVDVLMETFDDNIETLVAFIGYYMYGRLHSEKTLRDLYVPDNRVAGVQRR